jgi:hypothetical protein
LLFPALIDVGVEAHDTHNETDYRIANLVHVTPPILDFALEGKEILQ